MEQARHPDVSDIEFRRELSLIAGSSVDPEIIIRVHTFNLDEGYEPTLDLNRWTAVQGGRGEHNPNMEMSVVLATLRDINSFLEERSKGS